MERDSKDTVTYQSIRKFMTHKERWNLPKSYFVIVVRSSKLKETWIGTRKQNMTRNQRNVISVLKYLFTPAALQDTSEWSMRVTSCQRERRQTTMQDVPFVPRSSTRHPSTNTSGMLHSIINLVEVLLSCHIIHLFQHKTNHPSPQAFIFWL